MPRFVVIAAMEAEIRHIREASDRSTDSISTGLDARSAWSLSIFGNEVIAIRSGIGMLNAAASAQWAIATLQPDAMINVGCAGAHRRDIMPGDVIIGSETVNTGALNILRDGSEAHNGRGYRVGGEQIFPAVIDANPSLLNSALVASQETPIADWPIGVMWPTSIQHRSQRYHVGPIASSEIWTQHLPRLDVLHERHASLCEDNESAAYAHVCYIHDVPFLAIRDIANNEYHAASDLAEFSDFRISEVGKRAADLALAMIRVF
jgi:adenosylhomocysteine nucleosidase